MDPQAFSPGAGSPSFRIFISSPGDVATERDRAKDVVNQLARWYGANVTLVPVLWEDLPLTVEMPFQDQIDVVARSVDIAVFIVWSKIGTPVTVAGKHYLSGTEREFDLMLRTLESTGGDRPDVLFYHRRDDQGFDDRLQSTDDDGKLRLIEQKKLASAFVQEHFWSPEGNVRAYHSFQRPVDFAGRLKVHLRGLIDQRLDRAGVSPQVVWTDEPYRGLDVFDLQHATIFFGRETEVAELEQRCRDRHRAVLEASDATSQPSAFVVVVGASGSGKSSLVRAGLRASLIDYNLDESVQEWRTVVLVPGQSDGQPLGALVRAIAEADGALPELRDGGVSLASLTESLGRAPRDAVNLGFTPVFQGLSNHAGGRVQLLIVVDQFEELFTGNRIGEVQREAFLRALQALAQCGWCWVVATLRSDFYSLAQRSETFLQMKGDTGQFDLLPPGPDALRRIITEPARLAGVSFEQRAQELGGQSLAARILQDTQGQADLLPLLSDCLLELYRRRTAENVLTFAEYERLGDPAKGISGLEGALTHRAEQVFQSLSAELQSLFPELLHALINVEANSDAFALRRRARKDTLASDRDSTIRDRKSAILDALIQARLLTAEGESGSGAATVSLAHEALLRKWDRIAGWVRENRKSLQIRSQVEQSQKRWETQGRRSDLLLAEGLDLEEGLSLLNGAPQLIHGAEYEGMRDYVSRSFAFHDRRHRSARRRRRAVISALVLLTAGSLVGAAFAFLKEREANSNLYRALVSDAKAQMKGMGTGWWWKSMDNIRSAAGLDVPERDRAKLRDTAIGYMAVSTPCFQLQETLEGHKGTVRSVAVSPDGQFLASASDDGTVKLWSMEDGKSLGVQVASAPIASVAIHPNSRLVAFSPASGKIRFWEKAAAPGADGGWRTSSSSEETEVGHGFVYRVAFSPDGQSLAAACQDGTVCLIPVPPGARKIQTLRGHARAVICAAFSPDGKQLATGSEDRTIQFWNVATGLPTRTWTLSNKPFTLAWSPDGYTIAWADLEGWGFSWRYLWGGDAEGRAQLHAGSVLDLSFSDAGRILTASEDGTLRFWTRREFAGLAVAEGEFDAAWCVAPSPDRIKVVAGYRDGRVRVWQLGDPPQQPGEPPQRAFPGGAHGVAFQANSRLLVTTGSVYDFTQSLSKAGQDFQQPTIDALAVHPGSGTAALGRADGSLVICDYRQPREVSHWNGHRNAVTSLSVSPDGAKLASAGVDGTVKLWSWGSDQLDRELEPGLGSIHQIAWSDDGQSLAVAAERGVAICEVAGQSAPKIVANHPLEFGGVAFGSDTLAFPGLKGRVEICDAKSGRQLRELPGHGAPVSALAFSKDRSLLATAAPDKTIRIWDVGAGAPKRVLSFEGLSPSWMTFTPSGRYLLTGGPFRGGGHTGTNLWDIETGRKAAWIGPGFYSSGQFLPDGAGFLLGTHQGALRLLRMADIESRLNQAASGDPVPLDSVSLGVTILPGGHTDTVWGVAASPDGRWIATASHDQTVKLWDAKTLKLVRSLEGHAGLVWCVAFSPDSKCLASGSREIILWDVSIGHAIRKLNGHTALVSSLAFNPSGKWLVSSSLDRTIRVWDPGVGKAVGVLCGFNDSVHGVAFRPDGRWLAAACNDRSVALWDLNALDLGSLASNAVAPTRTLLGHSSPVWSVAFDPQGQYLASGAGQGAVILWDGDTFQRVVTLKGENNDVRSLSFSGDGKLLAAAVYAKLAIVWDLAEMRRTLGDLRLDWGQ